MSYKYRKGSRQWQLANNKAKKLGVRIEPSKRKHKKLDVFSKQGKYITSIGDNRYSDFNYHRDRARRKRYQARHQKYRNIKGTRS